MSVKITQGLKLEASGDGTSSNEEQFRQVMAGERNHLASTSGGYTSLIEEAAALAEGRAPAPEQKPGSRFTQLYSEAISNAGGYSKLSGRMAHIAYLVESGEWAKMPTRACYRLFGEALGSDSFDSLLLDSQFKRMTKGFTLRVNAWERIVSFIRNVADFRTQNTLQVGSIGVLPKVGQGAPFLNTQFSDDKATYSVAKYGAIYATTLEALANDDMQELGATAQRMGQAMAMTIEEFVFSTLLNANPTIYDNKTLFHADHLNDLGSGKPLNEPNLEAAKKKLRNQTDLDGQPLDLTPKILLVHPDQEFDALRLVSPRATERPGTANRDINVHAGSLEVVVSSRVTSGYWYLIADPMQCDGIEMGFLGGKRTPDLFEEAETAGRWFDFDEKRWKIRHVFGGAVVDFRPFVRGYNT